MNQRPKPETLKLLEENIGSTPYNIGEGKVEVYLQKN